MTKHDENEQNLNEPEGEVGQLLQDLRGIQRLQEMQTVLVNQLLIAVDKLIRRETRVTDVKLCSTPKQQTGRPKLRKP